MPFITGDEIFYTAQGTVIPGLMNQHILLKYYQVQIKLDYIDPDHLFPLQILKNLSHYLQVQALIHFL